MGLYQNRIVVKVGTSTLTNEMGKSNLRSFDHLACVLSDIQNMGFEVVLVSSGAIAVGRNKLNMKSHPSAMRLKQAAALATAQRINTVVINGKYPEKIYDILHGEPVGTLFIGKGI